MAGREEVFQKSINEGHSAAWDQNWEAAAKAYLQALAEFPDNAAALNSYALALYQLQNFEDALKAYIRAARAAPDDPVAFEKISEINQRLGNLKDAIQSSLHAAELHLKLRDVEKAVENWVNVIQLQPANVQARSRLALIHEKTGQKRQAVSEYIALASVLQNSGNQPKAIEVLQHAGQLDPQSGELMQAVTFVRQGKMLPMPAQPKSATGPLRGPSASQAKPVPVVQDSPDPIAEARQKALKVFADVLFDMDDDSDDAVVRRGLASIVKSTGQTNTQQVEQTKILLHLSEVIDAQTRENDARAIDELQKAVNYGFNHAAGYFDLGLLHFKSSHPEEALRNLQQCVKHNDFALAARLLSGTILRGQKQEKQAASEYLQALKIADVSVVSPEQADAVRQLYEPLIEAAGRETDLNAQIKLCDNVEGMLNRVNWRAHLLKMRSEMPDSGEQALPLAEIIIQAQSSQVIEAMKIINDLARKNFLRSAMDEAFHTLIYAPTYLPLHILIGDLLIRDGRTDDAILKFTMVANSYSVRGEAAQATTILKRVIQLAPMDLASRNHLIEQLLARGQVDDAISEYMDLADIYYRLAELDMARKVYTTALRMSQQPNASHDWSLKILQRMADIDMQRLDWRQAVRVYEQIRTICPDDPNVRESLIDLNLRLSQVQQAQAELDAFVSYLESKQRGQILPFLRKLVEDHPEQAIFQRTLADHLYRSGDPAGAVSQLDSLGDRLMGSGDKSGAAAVIKQIIAMNPPNVEDYRRLLTQI